MASSSTTSSLGSTRARRRSMAPAVSSAWRTSSFAHCHVMLPRSSSARRPGSPGSGCGRRQCRQARRFARSFVGHGASSGLLQDVRRPKCYKMRAIRQCEMHHVLDRPPAPARFSACRRVPGPRTGRWSSWRPAAGRSRPCAAASAMGTQRASKTSCGLRHRVARRQPARQEDVDDLGQHAGRAEELAEAFPVPRGHAGLFGELALRALERRLAVVDLAGRQLGDPAARRMAELAQQADATVRRRARPRRRRPGGARSPVPRPCRSAA